MALSRQRAARPHWSIDLFWPIFGVGVIAGAWLVTRIGLHRNNLRVLAILYIAVPKTITKAQQIPASARQVPHSTTPPGNTIARVSTTVATRAARTIRAGSGRMQRHSSAPNR
jgi:hypothetical protein